MPLSVSMPRNSPTISMVRTSASESFGAGPRWRMRRPLSRSSMRQKTATMKVLRSIRRPPLCVRCYWANTERKEVFSLAQLFTRNLHMGLVRRRVGMEEKKLPKFDYYLDESDPDIVVLRRQNGSFVAAFSARGATREGIVEAAREDYKKLTEANAESLSLREQGDRRRGA